MREDIELIKGLFKLESTQHGNLEETFFVFFTGFEGSDVYAYDLASDWLNLYEKEAEKKDYLKWNDFEYYKDTFSQAERENEETNNGLMLQMWESFKKFEGRRSKMIIGILPEAATMPKEFAAWVLKIIPLLPKDIAITIIDDANHSLFDNHSRQNPEAFRSIYVAEIINTKNIYKKLATQGNPNDPQVIFRKCLFEMGEAAKAGNKTELYKWGGEALTVTQKTGDKLFWASAHIVFAGFLFGFKDEEKINALLDKGISIVKPLLHNKEQQAAAVGILGQFFSYKGAFAGICKKHREGISWFEKQGDLLVEHQQVATAIGAYQNAILLALRHNYKELVNHIVQKAFPAGYALEDDWLRSTGFPVIAYHYLDTIKDTEEKEKIEQRISYLYGDGWKRSARKNLAVASEEYVS